MSNPNDTYGDRLDGDLGPRGDILQASQYQDHRETSAVDSSDDDRDVEDVLNSHPGTTRRNSARSDTSILTSVSSSSSNLPRNRWSSSYNAFPRDKKITLGAEFRQIWGNGAIAPAVEDIVNPSCLPVVAKNNFVCLIREHARIEDNRLLTILAKLTWQERDIFADRFLAYINFNPSEDGCFAYVEPYTDKVLSMITDWCQYLIDRACKHSHKLKVFLYEVAKTRHIVPASLFVEEVIRQSSDPVSGGGLADVWQGQYRNEKVALKVLRGHVVGADNEQLEQVLCKEAILWRQLYHKNILPFYGLCKTEFSPRIALVSPWAKFGDLRSYLTNKPTANRINI